MRVVSLAFSSIKRFPIVDSSNQASSDEQMRRIRVVVAGVKSYAVTKCKLSPSRSSNRHEHGQSSHWVRQRWKKIKYEKRDAMLFYARKRRRNMPSPCCTKCKRAEKEEQNNTKKRRSAGGSPTGGGGKKRLVVQEAVVFTGRPHRMAG